MGLTDLAPDLARDGGTSKPPHGRRRWVVLLTLVAAIAFVTAALHFIVVGINHARPNMRRTVGTAAALLRALRDAQDVGGGTISLVPGQTYRLNEGLQVPDGVVLDGRRATLIVNGSTPDAVTLGSDTKLQDLSVFGNDHTSTLVKIASGTHDVALIRCQIRGASGSQTGILAAAPTFGIDVDSSSLSNLKNAITLNGAVDVTLHRVNIRNWMNHGVWAVASPGHPLKRITLSAVKVVSNTGHGASRYPIAFVTTGPRSIGITVEDSTVIGRNTAYRNRRIPGTADQISVASAIGVTIDNNVSVGGGDRGINVTSSTNVVLRGNTVAKSDSAGLGVGAGSKGSGNQNVIVTKNKISNCGLARLGPNSKDPTERAGIRVVQVRRGSVSDNAVTVAPTAGGSRETYGISMYHDESVTVRRNVLSGPMLRRVITNAR